MTNFDINEKIIEEIIYSSDNYMIHGPGGVGKSFLIRELYANAKQQGLNIYKTATTGIAAVGIGGCTLHRYSGIGLGEESTFRLWARVNNSKKALKRIRNTDILIVDEVSMLGAKLFTKLNEIFKLARESEEPFGGIRLVLVGDFFQLPPVKDDWVFKCEAWEELDINFIELTKAKRFTDKNFTDILYRIRTSDHTEEDIEKLKSRIKTWDSKNDLIEPTVLYPKKKDVHSYNQKRLKQLATPSVIFNAEDDIMINDKAQKAKNKEYYEKLFDEAIPKCIELKVGAQVMLKVNLDVESGLVNGSRGVICGVKEDKVTVIFSNRRKEIITKHTWEIAEENASGEYDAYAVRKQIPLILAYSLTIHKTQGCTLDKVKCDPTEVFEYGQAYVMLSRVRCLEGLYLDNFDPKCIFVDKEVKKYIKSVEKIIYE